MGIKNQRVFDNRAVNCLGDQSGGEESCRYSGYGVGYRYDFTDTICLVIKQGLLQVGL